MAYSAWPGGQLPDSWRQQIEAGLDIIFPLNCAFCRQVGDQNPLFPGVCRRCLPLLPFRTGRSARLDWADLAAGSAPSEASIYCAAEYNGILRQALLRFKFSDAPDLAGALASILIQTVRRSGLDCIAVAAVPLHRSRLRERGYNQAELLAGRIADALDRPNWSGLILRNRATERQSSQADRGLRQMNLAGAFSLSGSFQATCGSSMTCQNGRQNTLPVFLVDDILTTGTTLTEAARPFWQAGLTVTGLVVASDHQQKASPG